MGGVPAVAARPRESGRTQRPERGPLDARYAGMRGSPGRLVPCWRTTLRLCPRGDRRGERGRVPQRVGALRHRPAHRHGAGQHLLRGRARRLPEPARTVRLRQVDPAARGRRPGRAVERTGLGVRPLAAGGAAEPLARLRVPGRRAAALAHRAAERRAAGRGRRLPRPALRRADAARAAQAGRARRLGAELSRTSFPAACASASRSRARCSAGRGCC